MKEVYDFIKKAGTYYLATVDGDKASVRPFGTILLFEDKLYIQTGAVKNVSKQLHANPNASICCMNGGDWIRVTGKLILDDRIEAQKAMLDDYESLRGMYKEGDGNTEVWYFAPGSKAVISSFTKEPQEFTL